MPASIDDMMKDQCSEKGAKRLAALIVSYWHGRGYRGITAKVIPASIAKSRASNAPVFTVHTNIGPRGYPPLQPV